MNIFLESPEKVIKAWREFRESLQNFENDFNILEKVVDWFATLPESRPYMYWNDPEQWLTPWELIHDGYICRSGKAFLMEQTLYLSDEDYWSDRIELWWINDTEHNDLYLTLVVDNQWVLNYNLGRVEKLSDIADKIVVCDKFKPTENKHIKTI